jgi:hypothetical protein
MNPTQPELMRAAAAAMPPDSKIIAAMDADEEGRKLADVVRQSVELTGRDDLGFVLHELRIPGHVDRHSEVMSIMIPK